MTDVAAQIETMNRAFDEFKATHARELAEIKRTGAPDPLTTEKLTKLNATMDTLSESVASAGTAVKSLESKNADLEAEIGRLKALGIPTGGPDGAIDVKSFNAHRKSRGIDGGEVSADEAQAYQNQFRAFLRKGDPVTEVERKAMSVGSDPDGGYLVTPSLSGRLVTRVFETSLMRGEASSQTIGTDALEGSRDIGEGSAGWVGETDSRVVSSTPQLGVWRIPVHEMYAMPDATQKALDDANMDIEAWLAGKTGDKMGRIENTAFVVGTGSNQPRGFATYPTSTTADASRAWGTFQHRATGVNGDYAST